jgi:hypothetical protein
MIRTLLFIFVLFGLTALILYATDRVRRYGPAILTAALGAITSLIAVPFSLILLMMYLTGSAGEAIYAVSELRWLAPMAGVGLLLLGVSILVLSRRAPPPEDRPEIDTA